MISKKVAYAIAYAIAYAVAYDVAYAVACLCDFSYGCLLDYLCRRLNYHFPYFFEQMTDIINNNNNNNRTNPNKAALR